MPRVPVISVRVVVLRYWPERGAGVPGVSLLLVMATLIKKLRIRKEACQPEATGLAQRVRLAASAGG